ncbi:carboxypeptidase-like regulatory domain-containing protein [uncultured Dokdonia sp.]|uniref:carboxypeptidase-like regulatory domain-containing protein n=1 Tax=uncultured Dokdonia sp. TaxID=575653 RepID=UPI0026225EB0|nr:carboxypeptidase-like regulatory domain-containing protein [uncultured Dokdonia sp.]
MKKSMIITIPEPCHEDWATMTPTQKGKHCAVCTKEVIDFSKMTDEQLYKTATGGGNLCGRFHQTQLERPIQLQRKKGKSWVSYAASLLIPAAILSTQEVKAQGKIRTIEYADSVYKSIEISSLSRKQNNAPSQQQQKYVLKGNVSDNSGPIPGASVYIKGTDKGVYTDFDGNYELEITSGDTILFSYVDYKTLEVKVDRQQVVNVNLKMILKEEHIIIKMGKFLIKDSDHKSN